MYVWNLIVNTSYCQLCRSPKIIHFDMCGHECELFTKGSLLRYSIQKVLLRLKLYSDGITIDLIL